MPEENPNPSGGSEAADMGLFDKKPKAKAKTKKLSGPVCPRCQSRNLGLGYVDRVNCTVLHSCNACQHRWRDDLIDLASSELSQRAR